MNKGRILVVDDEPDLREILEVNLEGAGYEVDTASSAEEALDMLGPQHDLILLDVMMGGMSGFAMAKKLRTELKNDIPVIFLTAKDTENDLLTGFSAGGDDYIPKPFSIHEVLARVAAVLRRHKSPAKDTEANENKIVSLGGIEIDTSTKTVTAGGGKVMLTPKEFGILKLLMCEPGRVFSREEILERVWRNDTLVLARTVDVHIARIRTKLGEEGKQITNRQGYGYCFIESK